jgi:hypothetical protein
MSEQLAFRVARSGLWTDLQSHRPIAEFSYANVPLVLRRIEPTAPPASQTVVLASLETHVAATLHQGRDLTSARDVRAALTLAAGSGAQSQTVTLPSTSAVIAADGTSVTLRFPPYSGIPTGKGPDGKTLTFRPCQLTVSYGAKVRMPEGGPAEPASASIAEGCAGTSAPVATASASPGPSVPRAPTTLAYRSLRALPQKPSLAPAFSLTAPASAVVADPDGRGRLTVFVKTEKTETDPLLPILVVDGAEVAAATRSGASLVQKGSGWALTGAGDYVLQLENLVPGQIVSVGVADVQEDGSEKASAVKLSRTIFGRFAPTKD